MSHDRKTSPAATSDSIDRNRALVLFSGGQDSATCLAWALARYDHVETVGVDYGQRHHVELQCRRDFIQQLRRQFATWDARLGPDHLLDLTLLSQISDSAMTKERAIEFEASGLPNTFVPGRNLIFLTLASALAYRRNLGTLIMGVGQADFSGYPDCRDDTLKAMQVALNLGLDTGFVVQTPLMWRDKAATWQLAADLGGDALVDLVREHTHTCYVGDRSTRHDWGYGCEQCPACELRKRGYQEFRHVSQT